MGLGVVRKPALFVALHLAASTSKNYYAYIKIETKSMIFFPNIINVSVCRTLEHQYKNL